MTTVLASAFGVSRTNRERWFCRATMLALIVSILSVAAQGQGRQALADGLNHGTLGAGDSFSAYFLEYSGWERYADVWSFELDTAATFEVEMDTANVFTGCLILYRGNTPSLDSLISRKSEYGGTEMVVGLEPGVYSLEATGASYGASGAYTLQVKGLIPPQLSAHDVRQLTFGTSYGSITDGDSLSEAPHIRGNRADFWWFRVPGRGTPNLRLEADFPSVVNLYEGPDPDWDNHLVSFDDCSRTGTLDLETWLDVGTYCLEVSTCGSDPRGAYSLTYPGYQDDSGATQGTLEGLHFPSDAENPAEDSMTQVRDDSWGVSATLHELDEYPAFAIWDFVVEDGLLYAVYRLSSDTGWALGLWDLYTGERLGCTALRAPGTVVALGAWVYVFPLDWRNPSNTQIVRFSDTLENEEYLELRSRDGLACSVRIGSTNYLLAEVSRGGGAAFENTFGYVLLDVHGEQRAWCSMLDVDVAGPVHKMQGYRDGVMFLHGETGSDSLSEWRVDLSDSLLSFSRTREHEIPAEILATGPIVDFVWDRHRDGVFLAIDDRTDSHAYGVCWCASSNQVSEFSNWHWIAREAPADQEEMLSRLCLEVTAEGWVFVAAEFATPLTSTISYGDLEAVESGIVILGNPRRTEIVIMTHQTCPEQWLASEPMYLATRPAGGNWGCAPVVDLDSTDLCLVCSQGKYWDDLEDVGDFTYFMVQEDLEGRIRGIRRGTTRRYYGYHWISPYGEPGIYLFHGSIGFHTIPARILHLIEGSLEFPDAAIDPAIVNP